MPNENTRDLVARLREMPPTMMDARLLADYVRTGKAYNLSELADKSGTSLQQVTLLIVASGLDDIDKLPGYAVTREIFDIAESIYSIDETRHQWKQVRNHHKPEFLESQKSRQEIRELREDPAAIRKHYARIFFRSWAAFWDDRFLVRIINELDGRIISNVPQELLNDGICFAAVGKTGAALRYVPERLRSIAVCARAVASDSSAIAFTPSHLRAEIRKIAAASGTDDREGESR